MKLGMQLVKPTGIFIVSTTAYSKTAHFGVGPIIDIIASDKLFKFHSLGPQVIFNLFGRPVHVDRIKPRVETALPCLPCLPCPALPALPALPCPALPCPLP
jgi:hypothetical protein